MSYIISRAITKGHNTVTVRKTIRVGSPVNVDGKAYQLKESGWVDDFGKVVSDKVKDKIHNKLAKWYRKKFPEFNQFNIELHFIIKYGEGPYPKSEETKSLEQRRTEYAANENVEMPPNKLINVASETISLHEPVSFCSTGYGFTEVEQQVFFAGYGVRDND